MSAHREIVLDTETTGLRVSDGHRIIEIGCIELIKRQKTGKYFHAYINPGRMVDKGAYAVHGISDSFLMDKPDFATIAKDFCDFVGNSRLVIHNATFDMQFLNNELALLGLPLIEVSKVTCTLLFARKKYPGSPASLDALCKRFNVSLDARDKHGALIDADLLASVYVMMCGTIQSSINFSVGEKDSEEKQILKSEQDYNTFKVNLSSDERVAHKNLIEKIKNPIWNKFIDDV